MNVSIPRHTKLTSITVNSYGEAFWISLNFEDNQVTIFCSSDATLDEVLKQFAAPTDIRRRVTEGDGAPNDPRTEGAITGRFTGPANFEEVDAQKE